MRTLWIPAAVLSSGCLQVLPLLEEDGGFEKRVEIAADLGGVVEIIAADDPRLAGTQLRVPPGALRADTEITAALAADISEEAVGPAIELGPPGTFFDPPAVLWLPYGAQAPVQVRVRERDGTEGVIPAALVAHNPDRVRVQITSFTIFQAEPSRCELPSDCPQQSACVASRCLPASGSCFVDSCGTGTSCVDGSCLRTCADDLACVSLSGNSRCLLGVCVNACDAGCREGRECVAGVCQIPCTLEGSCPLGRECVLGACLRLGCDVGTVCPAGARCVEAQCKIECAALDGCLASERCLGGVCESACAVDVDCRAGSACGTDQVCGPGCVFDEECWPGKSCRDRVCTWPP